MQALKHLRDRRGARPAAGHRHPQGRHDLAAGTRGSARVRPGLRGTVLHRGEVGLRGAAAAALFYNDARRPLHRRQGRRVRGRDAAVGHPARTHSGCAGHRVAPAAQRHGRRDIEQRRAAAQSMRRALLPVADESPKAPALLLLRLPAQHPSTNVPDGSIAIAGIGCHGMAMWAKPGTTLLGTQMGGKAPPGRRFSTFTCGATCSRTSATAPTSPLRAARDPAGHRRQRTSPTRSCSTTRYRDDRRTARGGPLSPALIATGAGREGAQRRWSSTEDPSLFPPVPCPPGAGASRANSMPCSASCLRVTGHGHHLRPDLRGREAPPAQSARSRRSGGADDHQRAVCEGCGDCSAEIRLRVDRAR